MRKCDLEHVATCQDAGCVRCQYVASYQKWCRNNGWLLISPNQRALGSWALSRGNGAGWHVSCSLCRLAGHYTKITLPSLSHLKQHAESQLHRRAMTSAMDGLDPARVGAPTKDMFDKLLSAKLESPNRPLSKSVPGLLAGRKKQQCMMYCLAEAIRRLTRRFLRSARFMTLHPDGRADRLAVAFVASNDELEIRKGFLGQALHLKHGKGTTGAVGSIREIVKQFATPGYFRPRCLPSKLGQPRQDRALRQHLNTITKALDPDAAGDEQAAMRALRRTSMPNAIVMRDHTHAARRVLTRPWKADSYMQDVVDTIVRRKQSVTALIQHSHAHQHKWNTLVQA